MAAENLSTSEQIMFAVSVIPFLVAFCSIFNALHHSHSLHKMLKFNGKKFLPFFITPYVYRGKLNEEEKTYLKKISTAWLAVIIGLVIFFLFTYFGIEILKIFDEKNL